MVVVAVDNRREVFWLRRMRIALTPSAVAAGIVAAPSLVVCGRVGRSRVRQTSCEEPRIRASTPRAPRSAMQSGGPPAHPCALVSLTQFAGNPRYNAVEKVVPSGTLSSPPV